MIVWVVSETEIHDEPVSWAWIEKFIQAKGATFPVFRDLSFLQIYGHINSYSTSLPHQYLLDAKTMERIAATGGSGDSDFEQKVCDLLGVECLD
jgi:hypothetical protein